MKSFRTDQRGFTLPELVVIGVVALLLAVIMTKVLRPINYGADIFNADRRNDIAYLAQTLREYKAKHGTYPGSIPETPTPLGSLNNHVNLCAILVPEFMPDIPLDPQTGYKFIGEERTTEPCTHENIAYITGYLISKDPKGVITLSAPSAIQEKIEIKLD